MEANRKVYNAEEAVNFVIADEDSDLSDSDFINSLYESSGEEAEPVPAEASVQKGVRTRGGKGCVRTRGGTRAVSNKVANKQEHLEQPEIHDFVARSGVQVPLDPANSTVIEYILSCFIQKNFTKQFLAKLIYTLFNL